MAAQHLTLIAAAVVVGTRPACVLLRRLRQYDQHGLELDGIARHYGDQQFGNPVDGRLTFPGSGRDWQRADLLPMAP